MTSRLPEAALRPPRKKKRKKRKHRAWLMRLEYRIFLGLRSLLRALSLGAAYRLAETVVLLAVYLTRKHRARGLASLQIALGALRPLAWRRRIFWASMRQLAWCFVEAVAQADIVEGVACGSRHDFEPAARVLRATLAGGKGALLLSSHQGNSDLMATDCAACGLDIITAVRTLDNPQINALMVAERERFGRGIIDKKGFLKAALRRLRENGIVALQIDQDMGRGGIFVPYFGVPASTTGGAGALAVKSGAPVLMVFYIRRRPRRIDHDAYCYPLQVELTGDRKQDVLRITAAATAEVERFARRFPEQAFWVHRRWKTRPPAADAPLAP